jgi:uncharacterized iron-regulated protein
MHRLFAVLLMLLSLPIRAEETGAPWSSVLGQNHPLVGRIWLMAEQRFIDSTELSPHLTGADFILLGERHDNPDHHRLQAWALAQIIDAGRRPRMAFEMISPEQTAALDQHLRDHPGDVDGLPAALDWTHSNWPDWQYYQPLFTLAVNANLPIRAANLSRDIVQAIVRDHPLPTETVHLFSLDPPLAPTIFDAMAEEIRQSHCGLLPEKAIRPMVNVQRARDIAMAQAMADATTDGAVLIAGAGHTRIDRGVPRQLSAIAPGRRHFSLAFIEVDDNQTDPAAYGAVFGAALPPFDAIWFTPRINDDDPCAEMINFMKKKTEKESSAEKSKE